MFACQGLPKSLRDYFVNKPLLSSILVNTMILILYFLLVTPQFETNDDPAMMNIASGSRYGEPSEYLIFINVIVGLFLKFLYVNFPSLNWYVLLLYFLHYVSMVTILYVLLRLNYRFITAFIYLLYFVTLEMRFLNNLQFTTTAFVIGTSGFLLLFQIDTENNSKGKNLLQVSLGVFLFVISGLIRSQIFFLLVLLSCPFILYKIIEKKKLTIIIPVVAVLLIFFTAQKINENYYEKDPNWSFYRQYNSLRAQVTDYPHNYAYTDNTKAVYEAVGWSENDVLMFRRWSYADLDIFTLADLEYIVSNIGPDNNSINVLKWLKTLLQRIEPQELFFLGVVFILGLASVQATDRKYNITALLMALVAYCYLAYMGRTPDRVVYIFPYFVGLISVYYFVKSQKCILLFAQKSHLTKIFALFLITPILYFSFTNVHNAVTNSNNEKMQSRRNMVIEKLASEDYVYMTWHRTGIPRERVPEFLNTNMHNYFRKVIPLGGWNVPSPPYFEVLEYYNIDNPYIALVNNDDFLLVVESSRLHILSTFMEERYGLVIAFEPKLQIRDTIAYSVVTKNNLLANDQN